MGLVVPEYFEAQILKRLASLHWIKYSNMLSNYHMVTPDS